jgi:hypothetical protein
MVKSRQQQWNEANRQVLKKAQGTYNEKRPIWTFRPTTENLMWLEEERWEDEEGKLESNAALINRKLEKLRNLEEQGF